MSKMDYQVLKSEAKHILNDLFNRFNYKEVQEYMKNITEENFMKEIAEYHNKSKNNFLFNTVSEYLAYKKYDLNMREDKNKALYSKAENKISYMIRSIQDVNIESKTKSFYKKIKELLNKKNKLYPLEIYDINQFTSDLPEDIYIKDEMVVFKIIIDKDRLLRLDDNITLIYKDIDNVQCAIQRNIEQFCIVDKFKYKASSYSIDRIIVNDNEVYIGGINHLENNSVFYSKNPGYSDCFKAYKQLALDDKLIEDYLANIISFKGGSKSVEPYMKTINDFNNTERGKELIDKYIENEIERMKLDRYLDPKDIIYVRQYFKNDKKVSPTEMGEKAIDLFNKEYDIRKKIEGAMYLYISNYRDGKKADYNDVFKELDNMDKLNECKDYDFWYGCEGCPECIVDDEEETVY